MSGANGIGEGSGIGGGIPVKTPEINKDASEKRGSLDGSKEASVVSASSVSGTQPVSSAEVRAQHTVEQVTSGVDGSEAADD